jgi:hypothetical protein
VLADCDRWVDVADFRRDRQELLRQFLLFEHGVPSHDTLARVFSIIEMWNNWKSASHNGSN